MRHQLNCCISSSMQHFSQFVPRYILGQNKKNAGMQAGVGILLQKDTLFFRRIRCLARKLRADRRRKKSLMSSRTVHSVRLLPFVVQAAVPNPAQNTCRRLRFEEGSQNSVADPISDRLLFTCLAHLLPVERTAGLVFDDPGFEEVTLLLQVDHLAHPGEGVLFLREQSL